MLGPRRIFFLSVSPHFLCSSTKRKKGKKNYELKIKTNFSKSRKVETDTKTL